MSSRITIKEVAKVAGVSYQTVSKVLNKKAQVSQETESRIWKAVHELGYHPNLIARSLRSQRSHTIGYSWEPTPPGQVNPILDQFLQSMITSADAAGYQLLAFPYHEGQGWIKAYKELVDTNRVDGFVLTSVNFNDPRISFLRELNFPFIAFGRSNPDWEFPYVDVNGAQGMQQVVQHLVEQNHHKIAALVWPEESRVGQNRMQGLVAGLQQAGIYLDSIWVQPGGGNYEFGYEGASRLLALPAQQRPTAIVCFNDLMAIGAMHLVIEKGLRVGADIAVTGFDDLPMTQYLTPPLTSVRQPIWEVGQKAISILLSILNNESLETSQLLLAPRLIVRASSTRIA